MVLNETNCKLGYFFFPLGWKKESARPRGVTLSSLVGRRHSPSALAQKRLLLRLVRVRGSLLRRIYQVPGSFHTDDKDTQRAVSDNGYFFFWIKRGDLPGYSADHVGPRRLGDVLQRVRERGLVQQRHGRGHVEQTARPPVLGLTLRPFLLALSIDIR